MANDFAKGVPVMLTGTANWAKLTKASGPDQMSSKYSVELTLDADSQKLLTGMKILNHVNVKTREGEYKYEQPTVRMKSMTPPTLWDSQRNLYEGMIGNGSVLRVKGVIKSWEMAGNKGLTCYINKGVVLDLKEIEDNPEEMDALFEGVEVTPEQASFGSPKDAPVKDNEDDDLPF